MARPIVEKAIAWILTVAEARKAGGPGVASYTDFCDALGLGSPLHNKLMDSLLAEVMHECEARDWPDLASLVVHLPTSGARRGPGDGWYLEHGYLPGDLPEWIKHRDECWAFWK